MPPLSSTAAGSVRPPRQARSRATLERVLDAAEYLLANRTLEEITLSDILRRSRVSVGAFYARFENKETLVPCLYERYDRRISDASARVLDPARWTGRPLCERVDALFRYVVTIFRRERGLLRALILHARMHPEAIDAGPRQRRAELYTDAAALLLECRSEMTHLDPDRAVSFGLLMALSTFREKILLSGAPHAQSVEITDKELAREAANAFISYVGGKGV